MQEKCQDQAHLICEKVRDFPSAGRPKATGVPEVAPEHGKRRLFSGCLHHDLQARPFWRHEDARDAAMMALSRAFSPKIRPVRETARSTPRPRSSQCPETTTKIATLLLTAPLAIQFGDGSVQCQVRPRLVVGPRLPRYRACPSPALSETREWAGRSLLACL